MKEAEAMLKTQAPELKLKELVEILMESAFYFDLTLSERHLLIKRLLSSAEKPEHL
ncbi:MAG: hypothetical protein P8Y66_10045 [Nitrospirota bacterium]